MPKVSVIVPVYGVEKYIERCAISLFEQTLDDIEYIFIDDCTVDKSIYILKGVMEKYPKRIHQVKIHRMPTNSGQAKVRQWGIKNAKGEFIIHCDSDDWIEPSMYERMYKYAINEGCDIVKCNFSRDYPNKRKKCKILKMQCWDNKHIIMSKMLRGNDLTSLCDKLVSKKIAQNPKIIYPVNNLQEDHVLVMQYVNLSNKIGYIKDCLYHYCENPTSITRKMNDSDCLDRLQQVVKNSNLIFAYLQNENLMQIFQNEIKIQKFRCREHLDPIIHKQEYFKLWKNIYPELNCLSFLVSNASIIQKIKYLLVYLRLFTIVKKYLIFFHLK